MIDEGIIEELWIYGLKNALNFNGTPNKKAIMGKIMAFHEELRSQSKMIIPEIDKIISQIKAMNLDQMREKLLDLDPNALEKEERQESKKELPELPNTDKFEKIVMRLAPYPSGALHIGNARMIVLNNAYIENYGGELLLVFDDTIGSPKSLRNTPKAKYVLPEAYDMIEEGLEWLGVKYSKKYYKSDRLEIYYQYCEQLIKDQMAYVCFCAADVFRDEFKNKKKNCPHRGQTTEENMMQWRKMLAGNYEERTVVVRLKTGMQQKDPALRDQIIMRISEATHPRVGNKYTIWPMLEFSWAIDDYLLGVTHVLRGSDLVKEDFIENFIWDHFNWRRAEFLHYGRLNFPEMKLSKTDARNNIEKGNFIGWHDPRTWSLQSLKMRGIEPLALKESLLDLGMSLSGITFSVNWLYAKNKAIIDEISNRYFYVESPKEVMLEGIPFQNYEAKPLLLPSNPSKGSRTISIDVVHNTASVFISTQDFSNINNNEIIRLKDLFNIQIKKIDKEGVTINAEFHSQELNREHKIIHWVPKKSNVSVSILKPDGSMSNGKGEINLNSIPMNKPVQFERYGFVNPIKFEGDELFCYFTH